MIYLLYYTTTTTSIIYNIIIPSALYYYLLTIITIISTTDLPYSTKVVIINDARSCQRHSILEERARTP